jgi:hypothetical protein
VRQRAAVEPPSLRDPLAVAAPSPSAANVSALAIRRTHRGRSYMAWDISRFRSLSDVHPSVFGGSGSARPTSDLDHRRSRRHRRYCRQSAADLSVGFGAAACALAGGPSRAPLVWNAVTLPLQRTEFAFETSQNLDLQGAASQQIASGQSITLVDESSMDSSFSR